MEITIQQAVTAHQEGRLEEAERLYRSILENQPTNLVVNKCLGVLLHNLGRLDEAEASYKKVIELKPDDIKTHFNLGNTLFHCSRFDEAEASYKKVIELKPDYADAYYNLGNTLKELNRFDEAEVNFEKLMILNLKKAKDFCEKLSQKELRESPEKSAFVYREATERGYFLQNDLIQFKTKKTILPILTWPFLDFIQTLDLKDITLHELGSGNSTTWFSDVFKFVESYETNENWYKELKPRLNNNVSLKLTNLENIYNCSIKFKSDDWLLIDFAGKRTKFIQNLCKLSLDKIPSQIILDNSERYRNGAKILIEKGYIEIPFYGFNNSMMATCCTSLFLLKDSFKIMSLSKFYYPKFSKNMHNSWDEIN
jgi:Tfp pilus assembly protein PilF